jgi:hypothetical protein
LQPNEVSVLTDTKTNNTSSDLLFENNFAYVTEEGEIYLKETKFFNKRVLAKVDPDSVDSQIKKLEDAFSSIEEKFDTLFDETAAETDEQVNELEEKIEELKKNVAEVDAIGDFEQLINKAEEKLSEVKKSVKNIAADDKKSEVTEEVVISEEGKKDSKTAKEVESKEEADNVEVEKEPNETVAVSEEKKDKASSKNDGDEEETAEDYYKGLADKAETLAEMGDWAYASMEFDNIDTQWEEGPDPEDADIKPYRKKIDELREQFEEKKKAHYEEQKRIKQENLEKKKNLLDQLKKIVDEEKWTHTRDVGKIKGKWDSIKPIPAGEQEKLEVSFQKHLDTFDEHKVDRLVKKKQQ